MQKNFNKVKVVWPSVKYYNALKYIYGCRSESEVNLRLKSQHLRPVINLDPSGSM